MCGMKSDWLLDRIIPVGIDVSIKIVDFAGSCRMTRSVSIPFHSISLKANEAHTLTYTYADTQCSTFTIFTCSLLKCSKPGSNNQCLRAANCSSD